jgi:hypothetical protein
MQNLRTVLPAAAIAALVCAVAAPAFAAEFVTNGGFEDDPETAAPISS